MESVFRLSYSEHEVASRLQSLLRDPSNDYSVTVPLSRQNKGWDLLIHSSETGRAARIQVKASRCYFEPKRAQRGFTHVFWFKNFRAKLAFADFFVLFGVHPTLDREARNGRGFPKHWDQKTMIFSRLEVDEFLPSAAQKFFYLGFDEDRPEHMLCLNGRKQILATFSYEDVRSTTRGAALKAFLKASIEPPSCLKLPGSDVAA